MRVNGNSLRIVGNFFLVIAQKTVSRTAIYIDTVIIGIDGYGFVAIVNGFLVLTRFAVIRLFLIDLW